ncbi:ABC transporter [Sphaerisporangium melleum]|uniref:ABC transporter n=1 Tax=Sphaerisporangium melleum TaxID=321316 RepID=A0A917RS83_9ACTN|nr:ABC transporter ATP-binding protein [Sphaerisporangium melleum]GGL21650.1 ABC transporter [Sphaerisporangium melleum]GII71561.1 ABC transporter [Sphaerisporangium melleum]
MLDVVNLRHTYGEGPKAHQALGGIDLKVSEGELVCVVGPSGAGKSTLLRSIAGLIKPTEGHIRIRDTEITDTPGDLAVVFQDYSRSLFPWMTVEENVALPLRRRGQDRKARRAAAGEALNAVGLAGATGKYPWELSGGMQQRVAIARAIAYRPSLMLMDEPFGSVDAQTREDLEDLVLQVRKDHRMTILLITHDIDESVYLGDRVVVLSKAPARVAGELPVNLPFPRDQIATRELPAFVHLRAEVGRLVRGKEHPAAPATEEENLADAEDTSRSGERPAAG